MVDPMEKDIQHIKDQSKGTEGYLQTKKKKITKKNQKNNKHAGDFKCTMAPDFVILRGLSTLNRCSLITVAQDKPYHETFLSKQKEKGKINQLYVGTNKTNTKQYNSG